ncbi:glycosyltransferase family 2 protein [Streptococcus mutans]|uniref:glycosyltransferase family 2 protein n=1 Tax=Streptococcus mutans TaxID=1309 RepID=UPI0002B54719|nr:glycosyltransferase family 2 protein [Streptococcus mutans]EMB84273.1 rhamnosyltransferase [Streptococcus mutans NVAB]EMP64417.1 rhamnosyltransferase [Streptococcus mutans ATCC 25175]QIX84860.1 glycosyltransferase family 2 protein [Streptococcus mutans]QXB87759.1 glycosyltransferase family 2 protein [Streptococcus mutans]WMS32933.1 glycosyltransferase family 2 protein [Streptococcus mutans]
MKVNILMSTYNGQEFIAQQIQSIQKQTFENWNLLIRDDGSSDETPKIIADFAKSDARIRFINADKRENFGVIKNFYTLLKYEKADYYFFSDQDDVWQPQKLKLTLASVEKENNQIPLMVYTDLTVVDRDLQVLHDSMIKTQSHHANTSLLEELTENTVTGGTMMVNHCLAKQWKQCYDDLIMHDWYLALLAASLGKLIYLDETTELYRQHESNVLGARTWSKRLKNWLRPHRLVKKYWWLVTSSQQQASHLLELDLPAANKAIIQAYVTLLDQSFLNRIKWLKQYGFAKNRAFHTFVFKTLIITKFGYRRK